MVIGKEVYQTMSKRKTQEEFIEAAQLKHGDKYDYSQVNYVNTTTKITIICSTHGEFEQLPGNFLKGQGCPECAKEARAEAKFGFEYKGVRYRSVKHACKELGKDYWTVLKRLDAGWSHEQAFGDEKHVSPKHSFKVNGIVYNGVADAVRLLNCPVSDATIRRRLAEGMTPEEAMQALPKLGYDNGIIYVVTNFVNNKRYVGLTTTSLSQRWERHLEQVFRKDASLIHKAIAEFGKDSFTIEVIDRADNPKVLRAKEREWIQRLSSLTPNGYNVTLGGEIGGSPGKPTTIPGDPTLYPTVQAATEALAKREGISQEAAEKRIYKGNIDVDKPHGMSKTRIYRCWSWLVHEAANSKAKDYNGSIVCERWKKFINFYEDMGDSYEEGLCLKLIDRCLPYSPDNCKWVGREEVIGRGQPQKQRLLALGKIDVNYIQLTLF